MKAQVAGWGGSHPVPAVGMRETKEKAPAAGILAGMVRGLRS